MSLVPTRLSPLFVYSSVYDPPPCLFLFSTFDHKPAKLSRTSRTINRLKTGIQSRRPRIWTPLAPTCFDATHVLIISSPASQFKRKPRLNLRMQIRHTIGRIEGMQDPRTHTSPRPQLDEQDGYANSLLAPRSPLICSPAVARSYLKMEFRNRCNHQPLQMVSRHENSCAEKLMFAGNGFVNNEYVTPADAH